MKKFFSMMMIAAAAISFAACGEDTTDEPIDKPTPGGSKLETPAPKVAEKGDTWFTISWEAVANADSYSLILGQNKTFKTTETSYKFEKLNAGEYIVRVKAIGEGYKDSDFGKVDVTLTGATSVDWFESSVKPAEENLEKGYGPYNAVEVLWKGNGVTSLSYGLYTSESMVGATDKDIKDALKAISAENLAAVNSTEGLTSILGPISGGTTYTVCLLVTNGEGVEFFSKEEVKTEIAEPSEAAKAWIGTWTVNATQKYSITDKGEGTVIDGAETFTVNITASANHPDEVIVDGWSVLGDSFVTYGSVEGDQLFILNGTYLGMSQDGSFGYYWLGWYSDPIGISVDGYPSNVATLDGETATSATSTNKMTFYDKDNKEVPVTCFASDVFGLTDAGNIYFLIEKFPGVYRTGDMTWTKSTTAAAQAANVDVMGLNPTALKSSVVLR